MFNFLAAMNTKSTGFLGLFFAALGIFAPVTAQHVFHVVGDVQNAINQYAPLVMAIGASSAYIGRPVTVPSNAPVVPKP